jgi:hypothetical protein
MNRPTFDVLHAESQYQNSGINNSQTSGDEIVKIPVLGSGKISSDKRGHKSTKAYHKERGMNQENNRR